MLATATRSRGRPRTFDEEVVLDALTSLFWKKGYKATSVAEIAEVAQLNKSSLYNTFGSKQQLFNRILDRYIGARTEMLQALVAETGGGIDSIHAFLEFVRAEIGTEMGRQGCMAVNTTAELGGDDPVMISMGQKYREHMAAAIRSMVKRVANSGDLDVEQIDNHTNMLLVFMLGLSVTARSGASTEETGRLIDAAHATVDSWRI